MEKGKGRREKHCPNAPLPQHSTTPSLQRPIPQRPERQPRPRWTLQQRAGKRVTEDKRGLVLAPGLG